MAAKQKQVQKERNRRRNSKEIVKEQPRKDNRTKRVNMDNIREDKVNKLIERDEKKSNANDISWYSKNPQLLQSAASIPISNILGAPIRLGSERTPSIVSGIMTLPWTPAYGPDAILNQCFDSMYSYIVHANSRNYSYNAPDLGVLIMAGMNVFTILGSMIRAYGCMKYYQERNLYVPNALLSAQGFNPEDLRENFPTMWFQINQLIDMTKQIWIPDVMPILDRWMWMNSNVFTDAESVVSQIYMFVQDQYYIYDEVGLDTGGALFPVSDGANPSPVYNSQYGTGLFNPALNQYTWSQWYNVAFTMIQALVNSEDRGIIFGDILNAYGSDRIRALPSIDASYIVVPQYNAEVMLQIENYVPSECFITGVAQNMDVSAITTLWGSTTIQETPGTAQVGSPGMLMRAILNYHVPNQPDPSIIVVSTRMMALGIDKIYGYTVSTTDKKITRGMMYVPSAVGTEVPHPIRLWFVNAKPAQNPASGFDFRTVYNEGDIYPTAGPNKSWIGNTIHIMAFDWHPIIYVQSGRWQYPSATNADVPASNPSNVVNLGADFDNYGTIGISELYNLHQVCIYSELGVPHF